ncbi:hypothetical protein [Spirosoma pollinicola]|uniref:Uncharacterized protein n=1 Tax=Spirosoma pollinicola TaxID=2057025 RepID=A0A2K8Z680_9BACT|nr:hypothetical protein [Spirosoma pollinicola]AUD05348.1 hypothetical protein CWM47_27945 [Spirosoma pollinicola]
MTETIQMDSIFAFMAKDKVKETLSGPQLEAQLPLDAEILGVAIHYSALEKQAEEQAKSWLLEVDLRHLSGSKESAYLKKMGHRPLTKEDLINLVLLFGSEEQKQLVKAFEKAQIDLSARLSKTANLGLVLKQAGEKGINYNTYYNRAKTPGLWRSDEVIDVMTALERLKV